MSTIRQGILASFADKYISQALAILTLAIMSRILTPAEVGMYLVANSVILLADNFRSFGVGVYIVQKHDLQRDGVRSAFTVTLTISLAIGATIYAAAPSIADYYAEPQVAHLLVVSTLAFAIVPFASPILALLQRELAFPKLAWLNIAAACVNAGVTLGLGAAGFGPVSYVWGFVASSLALAVTAFALRPETWIFRPSLADARAVLSFGGISTSVSVVNMAYEMLPRLIFGKLLGLDAAGLYARALTVCQLPDRAIGSAIQPVVLPAMAAHSRAGGDLKTVYLRGVAMITAVQWPILIMLALLADPAVRILLGQQWGAAVPLVQILALASTAMAPAFMTFPLLVSVGRIRDTLYASLISLPPSILIITLAATLDLRVVAASMFVLMPFQMFVAFCFVRRAIATTWREFLSSMRASCVIALATSFIPAMVVLASPHGFALGWSATAFATVGGALGWYVGLLLARHPLKPEIEGMFHLVAQIVLHRRLAPRSGIE